MEACVERSLGADDVAVGEGDDVVLVDDVLKNVGAEGAEAHIEGAVGDVERLAVKRAVVD
jgi:hypothetical protein